MAEIKLGQVWDIRLSTAEFRLVLKALGGRLKEEDIEEAKSFGDHMSRMRAHSLKDAAKNVDNVLEATSLGKEHVLRPEEYPDTPYDLVTGGRR